MLSRKSFKSTILINVLDGPTPRQISILSNDRAVSQMQYACLDYQWLTLPQVIETPVAKAKKVSIIIIAVSIKVR